MSTRSAPLRLLDRLRGRERVPADDPLARSLNEVAHRLRPDPLFERRLRGEILGRHVAEREGRTTRPRTRRREMGALGRAVLYASFILAVGTTAVGAAAQGALPGDALYPVKLRIEELRIEAAPAPMRAQLAAARLNERLAELEILAERGDWATVARAAAAVDAAAVRLEAFGLGADTPGQDAVRRRTEVLATLAVGAPDAAQEGLARAIEASNAATGHAASDPSAHGPTTFEKDHPAAGDRPAAATPPAQASRPPLPR